MYTEKQLSQAIADLQNSSHAKNSLAFKSALQLLENPNSRIVTGKNIGSGRFAGSKEWSDHTVAILASTGIQARRLNVAPRGGKQGERVQLLGAIIYR